MEVTEKFHVGSSVSTVQERNNRIINSCLAYFASYALMYVLFHVVTALFAKRYNLFPKLYFFKVEFTNNYNLWQIQPVIKTFVSGPTFCFFVGVLALIGQRYYKKRPGIAKLFLLWLGVHFLNMFCTQLALLPIKNVGAQNLQASYLGVVADYMFWTDVYKIIAAIISSLLLILIGGLVSKPFVQLTNSTQLIHKNENRVIFLFQIVFIPYILCSIVILFYFSDGLFILNLTTILTMFVIIISLFINALRNRMIMIYRMPETGEIENRFLIILVSILIITKLFFNNGIMI